MTVKKFQSLLIFPNAEHLHNTENPVLEMCSHDRFSRSPPTRTLRSNLRYIFGTLFPIFNYAHEALRGAIRRSYIPAN